MEFLLDFLEAFLPDSLILPAIICGIIFLLLGFTYLFGKFKFVKPKLFYSRWELTWFKNFIEKQTWLTTITEIIAKIGIVIGFGFLASDFLFFRKKSKIFRIIAALLVSLSLFILYTFTLSFLATASPYLRDFNPLLAFSFSFFGISIYLFFLLAAQGISLFQALFEGGLVCPGIMPIIPGLEIPGVPIVFPLYGWIALFIIIVIHETAHGLISIKEKLGLNKAGLYFLGPLPLGAFVEPNEQKFRRTKAEKRLVMASAGPSSNLFSIPLFLVLSFLLGVFFYSPVHNAYLNEYEKGVEGIIVEDVFEEIPYCNFPPSPAYGLLESGMRILEIDGEPVANRHQYMKIIEQDLFKERTFTVESNGDIEEYTIKPDQMMGHFGFTSADVFKEGFEFDEELIQTLLFLTFISNLIGLCFLFSFILAKANFLPLFPLDGGHIAGDLYSYYFLGGINDKNKKKIMSFMWPVLLLILLINLFPFLYLLI